MTNEKITALILSAGKGTRMKSDLAKVLHPVCGRPMLEYVLDAADALGDVEKVVVVGHQADSVREVVGGRAKCALQMPQNGTGHAVMCAREFLEGRGGTMLLLYGDVPLITSDTLKSMMDTHFGSGCAATVLTAKLEDPTGYGRIIRRDDNLLDRIVEHKDAAPHELAVNEINTGICCFDLEKLLEVLDELTNDNAQGEYYITDAIGLLNKHGYRVGAVVADDPVEVEGINTLEQLHRTDKIMSAR